MFFSENGVFRYTLPNTDENEQSEKSYDITFHALPRFFHTQFDSGVKNIQLVIDKTTDLQPNNGRHVIETSKASMVYWFEGGSHVSVYINRCSIDIRLLIISADCSYGHTTCGFRPAAEDGPARVRNVKS